MLSLRSVYALSLLTAAPLAVAVGVAYERVLPSDAGAASVLTGVLLWVAAFLFWGTR